MLFNKITRGPAPTSCRPKWFASTLIPTTAPSSGTKSRPCAWRTPPSCPMRTPAKKSALSSHSPRWFLLAAAGFLTQYPKGILVLVDWMIPHMPQRRWGASIKAWTSWKRISVCCWHERWRVRRPCVLLAIDPVEFARERSCSRLAAASAESAARGPAAPDEEDVDSSSPKYALKKFNCWRRKGRLMQRRQCTRCRTRQN